MNIRHAIGKVILGCVKNAPEILLVTGLVAGVATVILACKESRKVDDILEEHKESLEKIEQGATLVESGEIEEDEYSIDDAKKDTQITYAKTGLALVKNYAPAVVMGTLSVAAILAAHGILKNRYVVLGTAYTALDTTFKAYRQRVKSEVGEEADRHYLYGTQKDTLAEFYLDEKGRQKSKTKEIETVAGENIYSPFAKIFDETNPNFERDNERNRFFLAQVQAACQRDLKRKGYLWLNEVYRRLGFQETAAGQQFGWIFDDITGESDSFIDFNIFNTSISKNNDFVNGYENAIILDFNCTNILSNVPIEVV